MKQVLATLAFLVGFTANAQALHQSLPSHVFHYIGTHKELLASDALIVAALAADAASSVHCQAVGAQFSPNPCTETNPLLSAHPPVAATWGVAMGYAAGAISLDHILWHMTRDDTFTGHLIWLSSVPISVIEVMNVKSNVNTTEGIENARKRLQ